MASVSQLHHSLLTGNDLNPARHIHGLRLPTLTGKKLLEFTRSSLKPNQIRSNSASPRQPLLCASGGGGSRSSGTGHGGGGDSGDGGESNRSGDGKFDDDSSSSLDNFGPIGAFLTGWRSRVAADPQFPFKVLMEEVVGVSATVFGDMATRPNFGLNELDFVFSTLVVGSILNFTLMYLLAPTISISSTSSALPSHMFEPGAYTLVNRLGTFVYKGTLFAAVGFAAGLVGTTLSNGLIKMRKKMDPGFESVNKAPPTVLNAVTWAIHMGLSANLRYQSLNGIEFLLAKGLPPLLFKSSVVGLRLANNVVGGMTFVMLARVTGSQTAAGKKGADQEKLTRNEESSFK